MDIILVATEFSRDAITRRCKFGTNISNIVYLYRSVNVELRIKDSKGVSEYFDE